MGSWWDDQNQHMFYTDMSFLFLSFFLFSVGCRLHSLNVSGRQNSQHFHSDLSLEGLRHLNSPPSWNPAQSEKVTSNHYKWPWKVSILQVFKKLIENIQNEYIVPSCKVSYVFWLKGFKGIWENNISGTMFNQLVCGCCSRLNFYMIWLIQFLFFFLFCFRQQRNETPVRAGNSATWEFLVTTNTNQLKPPGIKLLPPPLVKCFILHFKWSGFLWAHVASAQTGSVLSGSSFSFVDLLTD